MTTDTAKSIVVAALLSVAAYGCRDTRPEDPPPAAANQAGATVVLGAVEKDLTGDGTPESLRLDGVGPTLDSIDVTLTIESSGNVLFRMKLAPLTRTVGFDAGRTTLPPNEHINRLAEFGLQFFADIKFKPPAAFVTALRSAAPAHIAAIPSVIARDGGFASDSARAHNVWNEIQQRGVTIFEFSPGGDGLYAIGWSEKERKFFRLLECC